MLKFIKALTQRLRKPYKKKSELKENKVKTEPFYLCDTKKSLFPKQYKVHSRISIC